TFAVQHSEGDSKEAMSKFDFDISEFQLRHTRVRSEMANRGLDLLLLFSPVSINYLAASRTKAFLGFQCLVFPVDGSMTLICKHTEVAENLDLSIADEIRGWGGPIVEDPVEKLFEILRLQYNGNFKIGVEVPQYYLHPR